MQSQHHIWAFLRPVLLAAAAATSWIVFSALGASADPGSSHSSPAGKSLVSTVGSSLNAVTSHATGQAKDVLAPVKAAVNGGLAESPSSSVASLVPAPSLTPVVHEVAGLADEVVQNVPVVKEVVPAGTVSAVTNPVVRTVDGAANSAVGTVTNVAGTVLEPLDPVLAPGHRDRARCLWQPRSFRRSQPFRLLPSRMLRNPLLRHCSPRRSRLATTSPGMPSLPRTRPDRYRQRRVHPLKRPASWAHPVTALSVACPCSCPRRRRPARTVRLAPRRLKHRLNRCQELRRPPPAGRARPAATDRSSQPGLTHTTSSSLPPDRPGFRAFCSMPLRRCPLTPDRHLISCGHPRVV